MNAQARLPLTRYTTADRALAIALVARAGLNQAIVLSEEFPHRDELGDDLVARIRMCVEHLDAEIDDLRERSGRDVSPVRQLRLVPLGGFR